MTADNIGCVEEAEFIFAWVKGLASQSLWEFKKNVPEGWEFLGSGSYRSTWRSPSGVAYKVQHHTGSYQNNKGEYDKILNSKEREPLEGVRLPRCSFYAIHPDEGVIAMECVRGATLYNRFEVDGYDETPREFIDLMWRVERYYRLVDMHSDNIMIEDDTDVLIPVDFG